MSRLLSFKTLNAVLLACIFIFALPADVAQAAINNVVATGTSPSVCNQSGSNLGTNSGDVTAIRLASGDCVVRFITPGSGYNWVVPYNVSSITVLVVGAGGGGGAGGFSNIGEGGGGGGGGGGGQVISTTVNNLISGQSQSVTVGTGGAGGTTGGSGSSSWAGTHGRDGGSSAFSSSTAVGGGQGIGGGFWALSTPVSTTCNNSRSFTFDGLGLYYNDGLGGRGGNSANNSILGGRPYCGALAATGRGGAGASGAGASLNGTTLNSLTSVGPAGGAGALSAITGADVEYGTGGTGGTGGSSGNAPAAGSAGSNVGMGGTGGAGSNKNDNASSGGVGGAGANGIVIIRYTPDTTAPTFVSANTVNIDENVPTSTIVATIKTNESATITLSSTGDYARFTITFSDTVTAIIKFIASPNYEIPGDIGADNIYNLTLSAADVLNNSRTQDITIQVLDVNENPGISGAAYKGIATTITVNVGTPGKVMFLVNGKKIPNCLARPTSGANPSITATCNWKPSVQGRNALTTVTTPSNVGLAIENSSPTYVQVSKRTTTR